MSSDDIILERYVNWVLKGQDPEDNDVINRIIEEASENAIYNLTTCSEQVFVVEIQKRKSPKNK